MIFITGDCHAEYGRLNTFNFPEQKEMTRDDYVIVVGDFGYWTASNKQDYQLDWLENKPFTTLFIDGNHEAFRTNRYINLREQHKYKKGLYDLPVEEWHGGKVHRINEAVLHLMRGQVFDINGLLFFAFGGARSHDIDDGILDPDEYGGADTKAYKAKYKEMWKKNMMFRVKGFSWWPEEMPSEEEMAEGIRNLAAHDNKVDFILSHEGPASAVALYGNGHLETDVLSQYLQKIDNVTDFRKHIFGHYHDNKNIADKHILIYEQMLRVE